MFSCLKYPLRWVSIRSFPLCLKEGEALWNCWANLMAIYFPVSPSDVSCSLLLCWPVSDPCVGLGEIAKLAENYSHYSGRKVLCQMSCLSKFTVQSGGQYEERRNGHSLVGSTTFCSSSSKSCITCILVSYASSSSTSVSLKSNASFRAKCVNHFNRANPSPAWW